MKEIFVPEKVKLVEQELIIQYLHGLKPFECAKYARIQAKRLFNLNYPHNDA